jgi:SWIM zinc finger
MFSYSQIAKEIVESEIYNLGTRLYLDGGVGRIEKMLIENWRFYNIKDGVKSYKVTIPVLHLVLVSKSFDRAGEALLESTNCTCSYFNEFGVCKHIVAVCQAMQKEFLEIEGKVQLTKKIHEKSTQNVLGNIFDVEQKSKIRKLQEQFESYFAKSEVRSIYWFELFVHEVKKQFGFYNSTPKSKANFDILVSSTFGIKNSASIDPNQKSFVSNDYREFIAELQLGFRNKLRDYDQEKKVYYLMTISLQNGGRFWWLFWQDLIGDFSERQQIRLWSEVYRWKMSRITADYNDLIESYLVVKTDVEKKQILTKLQEDYENNLHLWLDFVMTSRYEQFLVDNLEKFDPDLLIDIAYILPEKRESIEIKIMNQIKIWSDFIKAGQYQEIIDTMVKWAKLGRSDYFWDTMNYIQIQHKKKPKLMSALKKLE